jgi:hypothetical protein
MDISPEEQEALESQGWFSHFVMPTVDGQTWVNYHTHGLPEHYAHPDFQLVLPLDSKTLHALAAKLVDRVKKGERFAPGVRVSGITAKYDVLLIDASETKTIRRKVLRVIIPDKNGNVDKEFLSGIFADQFQELP